MPDFNTKMHQNRLRLGLRPRPRWGSLQRSYPPDPLAGFKGPTSKGRGREGGGKGREMEGRGEGGEGRGREGGRGGTGRDPPQLQNCGCALGNK